MWNYSAPSHQFIVTTEINQPVATLIPNSSSIPSHYPFHFNLVHPNLAFRPSTTVYILFIDAQCNCFQLVIKSPHFFPCWNITLYYSYIPTFYILILNLATIILSEIGFQSVTYFLALLVINIFSSVLMLQVYQCISFVGCHLFKPTPLHFPESQKLHFIILEFFF